MYVNCNLKPHTSPKNWSILHTLTPTGHARRPVAFGGHDLKPLTHSKNSSIVHTSHKSLFWEPYGLKRHTEHFQYLDTPWSRQLHLRSPLALPLQVTAASVNSAGTVLAAVTVPSRRTSLDALSGPAEVTLWDLGSSVTLTRTITSGPSVHHSVSVTGASTAVFVHEIRQVGGLWFWTPISQ